MSMASTATNMNMNIMGIIIDICFICQCLFDVMLKTVCGHGNDLYRDYREAARLIGLHCMMLFLCTSVFSRHVAGVPVA